MNINEIVGAVQGGELDNDLRRLKEACEARMKVLKRNSLCPGATVRIVNTRPKYIVGATGTVVTVNSETATIDLPYPIRGPQSRRSFHKGIRVPLSCLEVLGDQVNFRKENVHVSS